MWTNCSRKLRFEEKCGVCVLRCVRGISGGDCTRSGDGMLSR
jgi:hypothetical protein